MKFIKRNWRTIVAIVAVLVSLGNWYFKEDNSSQNYMKYDQLITGIQKGEVEKIVTTDGSNEITVHLKNNKTKKAIVPSSEELGRIVAKEIEAFNKGNGHYVGYEVQSKPVAWDKAFSILTTIFIIGSLGYQCKKMFGDDFSVKPETSNFRFSDVAGIEEEKEQVKEVVRFLKNPAKYRKAGAKIPKGILLTGDPGNGKTLLAKAIAGEAGVPFFQVNGSSFEEKFVGVGASRIRKLFNKAKEVAPSIIFIDELDSLAKARYSHSQANNEQTLNQLLSEMDGFGTDENVVVIAATNYMEILDPAIIRAGRFDRKVHIPTPDPIAREKILRVHAEDKCFENDVSLAEIAKKTTGFSGADLANILNEAAIRSVNQRRDLINRDDIEEAILRTMVGLEKRNIAVSDEDKYRTAIHEAGHAVVSAVVRPNVKNFGISIIQRGKAGGYNFFIDNDTQYKCVEDLNNEIKTLYAGRVAESVVLGTISTSASSDFEKATRLMYQKLNIFGMVGCLVKINDNPSFNENLERERIKTMAMQCEDLYDDTITVVRNHKQTVVKLAELLIQKENLDSKEIARFMEQNLKVD